MKTKINIPKELVISSSTNHLAEVRKFVEMHAKKIELDEKVVLHITLAVDEACTNIIKHAYNNSENEKIWIKIKATSKKLIIRITDNGNSFDPDIIGEPNIEESQKMKKGGGLGMFLIKRIMDEVKYNPKRGSNELILVKYL